MNRGVFGKEDDEPLLSGAFPAGPNADMDVFFTVAEAEADGLNRGVRSGVSRGIMKVAEKREVGGDP